MVNLNSPEETEGMSAFGKNYSRYYDLLYKEKDYKGEVQYVNQLIKKYFRRKYKTLLDIGCGTGKHLKFFKEAGYSVSGIDISQDMINKAKKNLVQDENLFCYNSTDFDLNSKHDVIISLFHVMNYNISNEDLEKTFNRISLHLSKGGIFIFDFWYGPAVISDRPSKKIKKLEDDLIRVTRITRPELHANENIVDVNFEVIIEDKKTLNIEKIHETHKMRYLFLPEIEYFINSSNLKVYGSFQWLSLKKKLSFDSWYGVLVCGNE